MGSQLVIHVVVCLLLVCLFMVQSKPLIAEGEGGEARTDEGSEARTEKDGESVVKREDEETVPELQPRCCEEDPVWIEASTSSSSITSTYRNSRTSTTTSSRTSTNPSSRTSNNPNSSTRTTTSSRTSKNSSSRTSTKHNPTSNPKDVDDMTTESSILDLKLKAKNLLILILEFGFGVIKQGTKIATNSLLSLFD